MKKHNVCFYYLFTVLCTSTLYAENPTLPHTTSVSYKTLPTVQGKEFSISLPYTAGTGYVWKLDSIPELKEYITLVSRTPYPSSATRVGAPGKEVWTFKALKPTYSLPLEFSYLRPWEKDTLPVRKVIFDIHIQSSKE